jgi:hypothetical protein
MKWRSSANAKLTFLALGGICALFAALASAEDPGRPIAKLPASEFVMGYDSVVKIRRGNCHASRGSRPANAIWTMTIENRSERAVGNIVVETIYFARSGRILREGGGKIAKVIPPHSKRSFELMDGRLPIHTDAVAVNPLMVDFMEAK